MCVCVSAVVCLLCVCCVSPAWEVVSVLAPLEPSAQLRFKSGEWPGSAVVAPCDTGTMSWLIEGGRRLLLPLPKELSSLSFCPELESPLLHMLAMSPQSFFFFFFIYGLCVHMCALAHKGSQRAP